MKILGDGKFPTKIVLPTSKSVAIRALFLSAINPNHSIIKNPPSSHDFVQAAEALNQAGVKIVYQDKNLVKVQGRVPTKGESWGENPFEIALGEGATSARFLIAFLSRDDRPYLLKMPLRLFHRPHEELLRALASMGVKWKKVDADHAYYLHGPLQEYQLSPFHFSQSSQFASALEIIFADREVPPQFTSTMPAHGYHQMTQKMVNSFKMGQDVWDTPTDHSALSFAMTSALLSQEIEVQGFVGPDWGQPDCELFNLWHHLGGFWRMEGPGLYLTPPRKWDGFELNVHQNPDLAPPLILWAALAQTPSRFKGVKYLEHKESHRLEEMKRILNIYRIPNGVDPLLDELVIYPGQPHDHFSTYGCPDHRMTMTAFFFMKKFGGGILEHSESVEKSYPDFFTQFAIDR